MYFMEYSSCDEPPAGDAISPTISLLISFTFEGSYPDLLTLALVLQAFADHNIEANSNSIGHSFSIAMFAVSHVITALAFAFAQEAVDEHMALLLAACAAAGVCVFLAAETEQLFGLSPQVQILYAYSFVLIIVWMIIGSVTNDVIGMTLFIIADCLIIINTIVAVPKRVIVVPLIYWAAQYYLVFSYRVL